MYINKVHIQNIRSIAEFKMNFKNPSGWHVIIGDNGSGKSSLVRSIALALLGEYQVAGLRLNWQECLPQNKTEGSITLALENDTSPNANAENSSLMVQDNFPILRFELTKEKKATFFTQVAHKKKYSNSGFVKKEFKGFSAGFGPFRRFSGGSAGWEEVYKNESYKKLAAHLSLFGEDVALTEITSWLEKLHTQNLEGRAEGKTLDDIKQLVNSKDFLPHETVLEEVSSEGIFFRDGNGQKVGINQLSDGYRSILSLTFELIRQLLLTYTTDQVFENIRNRAMNITLPGVVLIDEIDAHLHPTWQTRIGQWFTKYFPNLQFIVTTHSPLICRAAENGTIWRLAAPGSDQKSGEVTGTDRDRLIYGNVLDAYGTEVFGEGISISKESDDKLTELAALNVKSLFEEVTEDEKQKMQELKSVFPSSSTMLRND